MYDHHISKDAYNFRQHLTHLIGVPTSLVVAKLLENSQKSPKFRKPEIENGRRIGTRRYGIKTVLYFVMLSKTNSDAIPCDAYGLRFFMFRVCCVCCVLPTLKIMQKFTLHTALSSIAILLNDLPRLRHLSGLALDQPS